MGDVASAEVNGFDSDFRNFVACLRVIVSYVGSILLVITVSSVSRYTI